MLRNVLLMMLAAGLCGCTSVRREQLYPGAAKPARETALLKVPRAAELMSVDGAAVPNAGIFDKAEITAYRLLPGDHELLVRFNSPFGGDMRASGLPEYSAPEKLPFRAEAGRTYTLRADIVRSGAWSDVRLWVVDDHGGPAVPPSAVQPSWAAQPHVQPKAADSAGLQQLKRAWEIAAPADRDAFRKWLASPTP